MRATYRFLSFLTVMLTVTSLSQAAVFDLDFETDPQELGVEFLGTAEWRDDGGNPGGYLSVTDAENGQRGVILFPDLENGQALSTFTITADLRVGGGTDRPADGFSFSFVDPDDEVLDNGEIFAGTTDLGANEMNLPEEGTQTGISVGFDEWFSGGDDVVGLSVRVDGELVGQVELPELNGEVDDIESLQTGPQMVDAEELGWAPFGIELSEGNNLTITYKNETFFDEVIDYTPSPGLLVFAGRTGGANSNHHIDNISIRTSGDVGGGGGSSLSNGLVAYWPLDENFEDAAGDFDGEEVGSEPIAFDAGQFGNGIVLDGEDQYVEITGGDEEGLDFVDSEMSVSAWFRVDAFDTNWQALIAKGEQDGWRIHRRGGESGMAYTAGEPDTPSSDADVDDGEIHHLVAVSAEDSDAGTPNGLKSLYIDGELVAEGVRDPIGIPNTNNRVRIGDNPSTSNREWEGMIDDVAIWNRALTESEIAEIWNGGAGASIGSLISAGGAQLQAGDADQDLDFDQLDLVKVQIAGKYLTGAAATWGDGDWDGAPGGSPGSPPAGNGTFDQLDIIAALNSGNYLTGPYAAVADGGVEGDGQTSIVYDPGTGEVKVDAPAGTELTSVNIDSAAGIFTGAAAESLGGSFDNDADGNIFKATFGGSFGSVSFGNVAQTGLSKEFVLGDLSVVGSLNGGGDLGNVDLVYVPEPSTVVLTLLAMAGMLVARRRR